MLTPIKARFTMYARLLTHYVCKAVDILESITLNARTQPLTLRITYHRSMHARLLTPIKARFTMYARLLTHYVCKAVDILESITLNARTQPLTLIRVTSFCSLSPTKTIFREKF